MSDTKYKVSVGQQEWDLTPTSLVDAIELEDGKFHVLQDNKSYEAAVVDIDGKTVKVEVNGTVYTTIIEDEHDLLVKKLGLSATVSQKVNSIKAPMPGLVLSVEVKKGDTISKGDTLLILEAMKMENVIKSVGEGTVKKVHVSKGMAVDKGLLMIELD